ncbi:MAG: hypothetical protein HKO77_10405 [Gemmatimonadetes bacterium]|nr:hypothetical protein [Gemmatimonadota bacterium]
MSRFALPALPAVVLLAIAALSAAPAHAQVVGTWEISMEGPRGARTVTVALAQEGDALSGVMTMERRGPRGGGGAMEVAIEEGTVDGDSFTFVAVLEMRGNTIRQIHRGTVDGDEMSGVVETPRGEQPFTGRRVSSDGAP